MLTAFAIGFVCFFIRKFFVKTKDLQSANSVFVDDNSKLNEGKELTESEFNDYVNSKSTMAVDKYGHKFWKNKKGQYHREDGPACEYVHGIKQWFVEGKELTEQQFNDYVNCKSTMTVDTDGEKRWRNKEGKFHRTDGPAIELLNGSKFWYLNGKLHRVDGPAVEWTGGTKSWYIEGKELTEQQFNILIHIFRFRPADPLTR